MTPLRIRIKYSFWVKIGKGSPWIRRKPIKPNTPTIFFNKLIWRLVRTLPAISKNITPEDQHSAVRIA
jgi:hypothetical protein